MTEYRHYGAAQGPDRFYEMKDWCIQNLYHGDYYGQNWHFDFPFIYFRDEKAYALFLLRWQ